MTLSLSLGTSLRRRLLSASAAAAMGVGLFVWGALGLSPHPAAGAAGPSGAVGAGGLTAAPTGAGTLADQISALQTHLRQTPQDASGWATLGMDYVQQAKITVDPSYYPKADAVLHRSLTAGGPENFTAMAGLAALEAARHHFSAALGWARRAVAVNPYNSTLYGVLGDAYTQLGRYDEAFRAIQREVDLQPGTPSLARASYAWELRGNLPAAIHDMTRALDDATSTADRSFARYYLAELALSSGRPADALAQTGAGLRTDPSDAALLEGRAKAEAALGDTDAALRDYDRAVTEVPQPEYVIELGDLYQSLGRTALAQQQYQVFRAEEKLFTDNGVALDSDATLFEADHGDPAEALALGRAALPNRPFLEMDDAYAWALHVNGRDREALDWSGRATALGMRNPLFHFHRGMIEKALGRTAAARADLGEALRINPRFDPLRAPQARAALTALGGGR